MHTTFEEVHSNDIVSNPFVSFKIEILATVKNSTRFYVFESDSWWQHLHLTSRLTRIQFREKLMTWLCIRFMQEHDLLDFAIWRDGACQSPYDNDRYQDISAALREVTPVERVN